MRDGKENRSTNGTNNKDCFVIMPIADSGDYEEGHFKRIYEDIFKPSIMQAGFNPVRADDNKGTNLIHIEILRQIIEAPIAICDLSGRNPNVLFELGIRQAFDKPVVLVKECGTPQIFDISSIRYYPYRPTGKYREVLEDQNEIVKAIKETVLESEKGTSINSIIRLLSLTKPASIKDLKEPDANLNMQVIMTEIFQLKDDIRMLAIKNEERVNNIVNVIEDKKDFYAEKNLLVKNLIQWGYSLVEQYKNNIYMDKIAEEDGIVMLRRLQEEEEQFIDYARTFKNGDLDNISRNIRMLRREVEAHLRVK